MLISNAKTYWAKVVGSPVPGYDKTKKEWSFDLALSGATIDGKSAATELRALGLGRYIKNKADDRGDYIHLKRKAEKVDGTAAMPIRVVDHHNEPWDKRLIGNGSVLNVSVATNERPGQGGKPQVFLSPIAIQVWDLKEYQPKDDFPTKTNTADEPTATAKGDW